MRFRVLGPIEVERSNALVSIGGPRQRRLLAFLLAERGQVVNTDRLVEGLWPDGEAPVGAARSTMSYVSRLRAVLGDSLITTQATGYRFEVDGGRLDVAEFEALVDAARRALPDVAIEHYEDALKLWRGPPYGEFTTEWWAVAESTRLGELRVVAREQRAEAMVAIGHRNRAIPDLEALSIEYPFRERPVILLMQALQATGREVEALRRCRQFRERLAEETGLDPSAELAALERAVIDRTGVVEASPGRPLRGYTIHEVLGEGAHGRVYAATQPGTERRVAIKVIRPELADSSAFVRRFEAEAQLVARLEHPHIVPLYDYWREPGGAYLVFRLLTGGNARETVIAGGAWSLTRVSRVVEEVGGALIAAHAAGVTHNDIRPANVLLDDIGGAYLTDFGIAIDADDGDGVRGDLRGFGWMLWELLTGSPPSPARSRSSTIDTAGRGAVPSLTGLLPAVPEGLDAVLARATKVDGGYCSVAELVLGWRAAVGRPEGVLSPIESSERRAADEARRRDARRLSEETTAASNPYLGLRAFDEADTVRFFGRTAMIDALIQLLATQPMATVVGASGCGKSSLVRAGLVPQLRAAGHTVVTMVPGAAPVAVLRTVLTEVSTDATTTDVIATMAAIAEHSPLVLVIDQLEECWTRCEPERRDEFLDLLTAATAIDAVRVVTTIRADLFDRPLQHPTIGPLVGSGAFVVTPMSPVELRDAVALPAARAGVSFDDRLVAHLVSEAVVQTGSLPLLQFTLAELYSRRVDGHIGDGTLDAVGGMAGAIGRRAEEIFTSLDAPTRADVRELFSRLVVPGDGVPDTRRRVRFAELPAGAREAIGELVDARLLVTDRDMTTREPTVEIAHEALITRWSQLTMWIDEDRRWIAQLQHLATTARAWGDGGRSDAELYRGSRLESIVEALGNADRSVTVLEREFVDASVAARDAGMEAARRSARRLRRLLVGVAAALVAALAAGVIAYVQRGKADDAARTAQIEALVGRAESMRATQRDTAALLAAEAYRLADTPRTRSSLFATFTDDERFLDAHRFDGERGTSGIVLPDGESAYVVGPDGRLHPYDLDSGALGGPLPIVGDADDERPTLAASPDGTRVAVASRSGSGDTSTSTIGVIDTTDRSPSFPPITLAGHVDAVAFSTQGNRLAVTIGEAAELVVLDATTGVELERVPGLAPFDPASVFVRVSNLDDALSLQGPSSGLTSTDAELVVGSIDGSIRLFDVDTATLEATIEAPPHTVSELHNVGDGTIVGAGRAGLVRVDLARRTLIWTHAELESCRNLTVVASQGTFYCGDPFGRLVERDLASGLPRRRLDAQNGSSGELWPARGDTELVAFGVHEPVVTRWRLDGSGPITRLVAPGYDVGYGFNPSGDRLLVARGVALEDADVRVIDVDRGDFVASLDSMFDAVWADDDTVIGAGLNEDGRVQGARVELADGASAETTFDGILFEPDLDLSSLDPGKAHALLGRRDGRRAEIVAVDRSGLVGPWITVDDLVSMSISSSGHRIAVGTQTGVVIFEGATGDRLGRIERTDAQGVFITLTDQLFVSSLGGELTQYDLESLRPIRAFGGSRGYIQDVVGSADGSLIAVRGGDRTVTLYDVDTGVRIGTPIEVDDSQESLMSLSEQGDQLAVGGGDAGVQIWELDPEHWVIAACRVAGRNLTPDEWATHIGDLAPYRATCPDLPVDN